ANRSDLQYSGRHHDSVEVRFMSQKRKSKAAARLHKQAPAPVVEARASAVKELLLLSEVCERTRLSDTTLWRLEKASRFPARVKIGFKRVAWRAAEIDAWIAGTWSPPAARAA